MSSRGILINLKQRLNSTQGKLIKVIEVNPELSHIKPSEAIHKEINKQ